MNTGVRDIQTIYENLNPEQLEAVRVDPHRAVLVLAGAGCGKTTVLIRRIAHLASLFCPPQRILALTFSRKAAVEMKERIGIFESIFQGKGKPTIATFHGLCYRILREESDGEKNFVRVGYQQAPALLDEKDRLELLAEITTQSERIAVGRDIFRLDNLLCRQAVHPQKLKQEPESVQRLVKDIYNRMAAVKRERGVWEFADFITHTLELFTRYPATLERYRSGFSAVLVDEFQDTNPLQITLLRLFIERTGSLFAVGDDDQAIYGFRGADIVPTLTFEQQFPGARTLKLQTNYRSTPRILAAANKIFKDKPVSLRKILRSGNVGLQGKASGVKPKKYRFHDQDTLYRWVHRTMIRLNCSESIPLERMALLFRINNSVNQAREYFDTVEAFSDNGPILQTVHGSKGLEFPVVFLCDLEEGVFPSYTVKKQKKVHTVRQWLHSIVSPVDPAPPGCDIDEERRLFYVGVTRAQRFLYLVSVRRKSIYARPVQLSASRFLRLI
jgi:superfamily I DNA/RNA helicase